MTTRINRLNLILTFLFFAGLFFTYLEIHIYRKTIIEWKIPTSIWLFTGLFITLFLRNFLSKYYGTERLLFQTVYNIVTWGGLLLYGFMALNYYSPNTEFIEYKFPILEKSSMTGRKYHRNERKPIIKINYFGVDKELVFTYQQTDRVNTADSIIMTVKKGRLGYDIINNYDVVIR